MPRPDQPAPCTITFVVSPISAVLVAGVVLVLPLMLVNLQALAGTGAGAPGAATGRASHVVPGAGMVPDGPPWGWRRWSARLRSFVVIAAGRVRVVLRAALHR